MPEDFPRAVDRRLFQLTRPSRRFLILSAAAGTLAGVCGIVHAYALSETVNGVFPSGLRLMEVWAWLELMLLALAARGLLVCLQEIAAGEVGIHAKLALREAVFAQLLKLGPAFGSQRSSAELASAAVDGIDALEAYFSEYLPQLVVGSVVPLTILAVAFAVDPLSGFILLLTAPLVPFFMYMIGQTALKATCRQYEMLERLSSQLLDSIQGLATLKAFGQSQAHVGNVALAADCFRMRTLRALRVSFLSALTLELVTTMGTAIVAVEVGLRLLYGHMEFQHALFLLILAPEFYSPLRTLGARFHSGIAGRVAGARIFEILDIAPPVAEEAAAAPSLRSAKAGEDRPITGSLSEGAPPAIELENVGFAYPGERVDTLRHLNLKIQPGEHVAIVGPTGAGKTTIAWLLLGFLKPTSGKILLNGAALDDSSRKGGPPSIGWVPQDPFVFHDTMAENIRLGRPGATDQQVARAAQRAHLEEFIMDLPGQYDAVVGEGGARLSSGERQRLALARAFLVDSPILILDEPSATLDAEHEARLQQTLELLGQSRTVIVIAHRLRTVNEADKILVINRGRVVEEGKHAFLLQQGGLYARLVEAGLGRLQNGIYLGSDQRSPTKTAFRAGKADPLLRPPPGRRLASPPGKLCVATRMAPQLFGFLRGSGGGVVWAILMGVLSIGSGMALMGTSAWLISAAALRPSIGALGLAIVGVRFFGISRAVFRYLERLASHGVTFKVLRNIRVWFYSRLEPLAPARLMDFRAGDLMARAMADIETLENFYTRVLLPPFVATGVLTSASVFMAISGLPQAAVILWCFFAVTGGLLPLVGHLLARRSGPSLIHHRADLEAGLIEAVQGMSDLVAFKRASERMADLLLKGRAYALDQRSALRIQAVQEGCFSALILAGAWLVLVLGIEVVGAGVQDGLMVATWALVTLASFEAVASLSTAGRLWPATHEAAQRLERTVSAPPAVPTTPSLHPTSHAQAPRASTQPHQQSPSLEFSHVTMRYPGRTRPAIRNVSFLVQGGRSLGIVGPSGAGKSTIASLLLRFWNSDDGKILFGGRQIQDCHPEEVRAQIGYLSQHPYLFDTTVYENLIFARRGLTRSEVEAAAQKAEIHDRILDLPRGYDTPVGEHGARLSAGERQKLAVARLLLKDAPLLVLDEPTAHLDALSAAQVLETLGNLMRARTTLLISHGLDLANRLDEIIVLDHGAVVQRGRHDRLRKDPGLYAKLWDLLNDGPDHGPARVAAGG